jgi:ATP-independent RNA helicase DbpA
MKPQFSELPLSQPIQRVLEELGFSTPTPIQAESLPILLSGQDLIGQSKTGSGKTLAFALPILEKIQLQAPGPQALVLSPTRELSDQVAREIRRLGRKLPSLRVTSLVGGQPFGPQAGALRHGTHIVVGTPGRVLDHLRRGTLSLEFTSVLVLDEADRMLDMGFEEDMGEILNLTPENRQTVLFSATFPDSIESISRRYQRTPARVTVKDETKRQIRELVYRVNEGEKTAGALACLQEHKPETAIIFCNLKATVAELAENLENAGISAAALHGDLDQTDRDRVMAKFRNRSTRVLVATDVAARGIDVSDLDLVINFDLPKPDVYTHRIGRTGRAGKEGLAASLVTPGEKYKIKLLEEESEARFEWRDPVEAGDSKEAPVAVAAMATLYIGGGRKDKVRPGDILGALTGDAGGLSGKDVGKIEIHDRFSYVAVSANLAETAIERLRNGKIKGRRFRIEPVK